MHSSGGNMHGGHLGLLGKNNVPANMHDVFGYSMRGVQHMELIQLFIDTAEAQLWHQLSLVQKNEAFLLHASDCAESFEACTQVRSSRS